MIHFLQLLLLHFLFLFDQEVCPVGLVLNGLAKLHVLLLTELILQILPVFGASLELVLLERAAHIWEDSLLVLDSLGKATVIIEQLVAIVSLLQGCRLLILDRLVHDLSVQVVKIVSFNKGNNLVIIVIKLFRNLTPLHLEVVLHFFEGLQPRGHPEGRDTFGPVLLGVKVEVLLHFELVDTLPSLFLCSKFDALSFDLEFD